MQNTFILAVKLVGLAVFFCLNDPAHAEIHGTITGTTNYVYRMYSKSDNKPAIQANLDYQHSSGFYLGTSVSSFDIGKSELDIFPDFPFVFENDSRVEITPYIGWSFKLADDWRLDSQYSRYFYDGHIYGKFADYSEFYLFLHYRDLITAQISYSNDFYGLDGDAFFYELTGRYPLTDYLEFSSTLGYAQTQGVLIDDYEYWNVGLTARYRFIAMDLRYHDAKELEFGNQDGLPSDHANTLKATVVFSLSVGF